MTATACRTGASPVISTGASRSGRAIRTGPAWRAKSSTSGSTRPSNISPARRNGWTRAKERIGNASGEPWKLVDYIKSFNYLNYDGGQFSTSQGRGVFMDQALEILPPDYWRWWLLSHAPENADAEFTWDNFQTSVNKDLADVLGNFVSRVTKFCRSKFGEEVPGGVALGAPEQALIDRLSARIDTYEGHMDAMEIRKSAAALRAI